MKRKVRDIWIGFWGSSVGLAVLFWMVLHRELEFSNSQSIVLAIAFGVAFGWLTQLRRQMSNLKDFEPYTVGISIRDWGHLLMKFRLMESSEWEQALVDIANQNRVVRSNAFVFTVLSHDDLGRPQLLYLNEHKTFQSGPPSFSAPIETLLGVTLKGGSSAEVFFGRLPGENAGYAMGLCVRGTWWDGVKTPDIAGTEIYSVPEPLPRVYLVLARLPDGEIELCSQPRSQQAARLYARQPNELTTRGWKYIPEDAEWQHTYFTVAESDIEVRRLGVPLGW